MKTNREKYDYICIQIGEKDHAAIRELLPTDVPPQFYTIEQYEAKPVIVTEVRRYRRGFYVKGADAKIMKKDVEEASTALAGWTPPALDDIMIGYSHKQAYGTISGAHAYPKIGGDVNLAWTAEALDKEIERRRELYAPREGHEPCTYCRKQTPSASMVNHTIHYRDQGGLKKKTCRYCSPACGGYDQMGHEG